MSGFVLMDSMETDKPRHTELGLSVYNTSLLTTGSQGDRRWLFSARRGNLDLVLKPDFGEPRYFDVFGEFAIDLSPAAALSFNALYADDSVTVILESDPAEREQVDSDTRNAQVWVQLKNEWSDELSTSTVLSLLSFENLRRGFLNDAEKIIGNVRDGREIQQFSIRQDWTWRIADRHVVQWGVQFLYGDAAYDYASSAAYFGLPAMYPDLPERIDRVVVASPDGGSYGVYVADRWKLSDTTLIEWGLRWDDQTYTELTSDAQLSPRIAVLRRLGDRTDLRFSWGRYHQSQGIHELQVEDGISTFWPAQRADHLIAGLEHRFDGDLTARLELFSKQVRNVRPRFENLYDPLGLIPEVQPDRIRLDAASAESSGVELSLQQTLGPWHWWAAYTWSRATDEINQRDEYRSWDQRHALQTGFGWSNEHWDVSAAAQLRSGWPTTDLSLVFDGLDAEGEPVYVVEPGPRNALRHNNFASFDVRISRRFETRRGTLSFFVEVTNLTDRENICCVDWDIDEGAGGDPILERSDDYWLPLLPAIGVLWEF